VAIHFNPKGKMLATASRDGTAKVWSLDGRELVTLRGHTDWVMHVGFSRDGKTLVTASKDKTGDILPTLTALRYSEGSMSRRNLELVQCQIMIQNLILPIA
jgi:WD40 repeat protein